MKQVRLTVKEYLALHPEMYIMVTYEFGEPIFIAPCADLKVKVTSNKEEAQKWSAVDNSSTKLDFHRRVTGYQSLIFEQC